MRLRKGYNAGARWIGRAAVAWWLLGVALPSRALEFQYVAIDSSGEVHNPHVKAVGDIDGDGMPDVLAGGGDFPAISDNLLVWYRYPDWERFTIQSGDLYTTDMQVGDVDGDGDLDVLVTRYGGGNDKPWQLVWYENPRPEAEASGGPWIEHVIGNTDRNHDLEIADMDADGRLDVVVRRSASGARCTIWFQDTPTSWTEKIISTRAGEGTGIGDVDNDGDLDVALDGVWLEAPDDPRAGNWVQRTVDSGWPDRVGVRVADINGDLKNDVILAPSESSTGGFSWYETNNPTGGPWTEHVIDPTVSFFHTFQVVDMDFDGDLDLVTAEMHQSSDPDEVSIYFNEDGVGLEWSQQVLAGSGSHNIRVIDLGSDGDLDIFGSNWSTVDAPNRAPIELWENLTGPTGLALDNWMTHLIDAATPWQSVFISAEDVDGDGRKDLIAGGWWYQNPGSFTAPWPRNDIGAPLYNMALVHDFDGDGDADILGTQGQGDLPNSADFVWGRNDGAGSFTILSNVQSGAGDFLQGVAGARFAAGEPFKIALSWHQASQGVQTLTVPEGDPASGTWTWEKIHNESQDEALSSGDIDDDGDLDLFQGSRWMRNEGASWTQFTISAEPGTPDRNRLADVDGDGDLDAIIGFEEDPSDLIWLEAPDDPTQMWTAHTIAQDVGGGYSLDIGDIDRDGDVDVVLGEHKGATRVIIYENQSRGTNWIAHQVDGGGGGIDHHDGTRLVDLDDDGDLDIISIGFFNDKVWIYENKAIDGGGPDPSPTPTPAPTATPTATPAPTPTPVLSIDFSAAGDDFGWRSLVFGSATAEALTGSGVLAGLCIFTPLEGDNAAVWESPRDSAIELIANSVYRIRFTVSTDQTAPNAQPLWNLLVDNLNPATGEIIYGSERWFFANTGFANAVGDPLTIYDAWIAPNAVQTDAWNGLVDAANSPFDPANLGAAAMNLKFRVLDVAGFQGAETEDSGTLCLRSVQVDRFDLSQLAADGAPLWGSTMTVPPEVAVQPVSASGSTIIDPPATVVDDDESAGTITIELDEPPSAGPTQLEQGLGRAFVAYNDLTQEGFATEFPVMWAAGDLLRLTSEIRATGATAINPVDVIATGWQTATNELGGFDFSFRGAPGGLMDRAASPRDDTTAGNSTYTSFFYTHNATAADLGVLVNADRVRGVVDFFNRTDLAGALGEGVLSDPVQLRSMAIERIVYDDAAFGPRP